MQNENEKIVKIEFTSEFKRNLRTLAKKYRHIKSDIIPVIEQLSRGKILGRKVPGTKYNIYKVRVKNTDIPTGKQGGYRVIYYQKKANFIILVTIYSKTEQADITAKQIRRILQEFD